MKELLNRYDLDAHLGIISGQLDLFACLLFNTPHDHEFIRLGGLLDMHSKRLDFIRSVVCQDCKHLSFDEHFSLSQEEED